MKYSYSDYLDCVCTREQYYKQFNPIGLEINKLYVQHRGDWQESIYKIIFLDDKIAVGLKVKSKVRLSVGEYCLFESKTGFKYNDPRTSSYKLEELNND